MTSRWLVLVVLGVVGCAGPHGNGNTDASGNGTVDGTSTSGSDASGVGCGLTTCTSQGATCGPIGDGCGGTLDCGTCPSGQTCGGGGVNFQCGGDTGSGSGVCVPRTCTDAGANCGIVSDGCGGVTAECGSCPAGQLCGAGSAANVCAGPPCTSGLCLEQNACPGMPTTTITGTVTAPGHDDTTTWGTPDPIYGALVYIPNGSAGAPTYGVLPFTAGVSCDSCSTSVTGDPLMSVVTGVDGTFQLNNAPCGTDIPLVIQLGRWRRQISIPSVACCATNTLTNAETHLPRDHVGTSIDVRSDIPLMAIDTGNADSLHCVLRKIGVADSEFVNPADTGGGRIRFYQDNGARIDSTTPAASTLYGSATELAKYDLTMFECTGGQSQKSTNNRTRVINYANAGGRVFATHYSYVWLTNSTGPVNTNTAPVPFSQTATWHVNQGSYGSSLGVVDTSLQGDASTQTRRIAFADWLQYVAASTTLGQIPVNVVRNDFDAVNSAVGTMSGTPAQQWLTTTDAFTGPLHYTFDTPIAYSPNPAPTTQCGRVLYSDFHVYDANVSTTTDFPAECTDGPMNAQEKTLEFMLFDLASCVGQQTQTCTPKTCTDLGYTCGESGDGCDDGVVLDCGSCMEGQVCGANGNSGVCGSGPMCTPLTCASQNAQCGIVGDGCGNTINCGDCPQGQVCGGNDVANQCGGTIQ